jgi:hypothetical protein
MAFTRADPRAAPRGIHRYEVPVETAEAKATREAAKLREILTAEVRNELVAESDAAFERRLIEQLAPNYIGASPAILPKSDPTRLAEAIAKAVSKKVVEQLVALNVLAPAAPLSSQSSDAEFKTAAGRYTSRIWSQFADFLEHGDPPAQFHAHPGNEYNGRAWAAMEETGGPWAPRA